MRPIWPYAPNFNNIYNLALCSPSKTTGGGQGVWSSGCGGRAEGWRTSSAPTGRPRAAARAVPPVLGQLPCPLVAMPLSYRGPLVTMQCQRAMLPVFGQSPCPLAAMPLSFHALSYRVPWLPCNANELCVARLLYLESDHSPLCFALR